MCWELHVAVAGSRANNDSSNGALYAYLSALTLMPHSASHGMVLKESQSVLILLGNEEKDSLSRFLLSGDDQTGAGTLNCTFEF